MSGTRSSRQVWHGTLAKAATGALLLGALVALLAGRLTSTAAAFDLHALRTGTPTPGTLAPLVEIPVLAIGCVVAGWWCLSLVLVAIALLTQAVGLRGALLGACIRTMAPTAVRRLAVAGISAGLALSAAPAMAAEPVPDLGWVSTGTPSPEPEPAPGVTALPDLVADDSLTASPTAPAPEPSLPAPLDVGHGAGTPVTVTAGDSLWSITAASLAADATDAEIASSWPALYAANSTTIGADPNVIVAGQVLLAPPAPQAP